MHRKLHGLFQVCLCLNLRDGECNLLSRWYFLLLLYLIDVRDLRLCTLQLDRDRVPQSQGFFLNFLSNNSKRLIAIFRLAGKYGT